MNEIVGNVVDADYKTELRSSYLDYAMSTIVSRSLPDVRDGLKPVHRRIMYIMATSNSRANSDYKKSARIVGDVMGKLHPHGDGAIYDSMVRMAQWWSLRHPLVDGQGNFGSLDNDPAAAMRYTEARMSPLAMELVGDIEKNVVRFRENYDGKEEEPVVLPAAYPNLLVNGVIGIAVGMATSMPTHNLREVIAATLLFLERDDVSLAEIMEVMPGPDFSTKGVIVGRAGIRQAYETGRGSIPVSGVAEIVETKGGRSSIVITELPYGVVKKDFVEKVGELYRDADAELKAKKEVSTDLAVFLGISDIRDESSIENPVRVVLDVKKEYDAAIVLNALRKKTSFQLNFSYNATCLDSRGKPMEMPVATIFREFVAFRRDVVRNRVQFDLDTARGKQSRQIARYAAVSMIDEVVRIIRASADVDEARARLLSLDFVLDDDLRRLVGEANPDEPLGETFRLIEEQANVILEMNLRQLTGLERSKIMEEAETIAAFIRECVDILTVAGRIDGIIRNELVEIAAKNGEDRLTRIDQNDADLLEMEDLIEKRDVVVTLTSSGYVKRTDLAAYKAQGRGGKGRQGMTTKDDDTVVSTTVCHTKSRLMVFTEEGRVYAIKTFQVKDTGINGNGRPIQNYVEFADGEKVASIVAMPDDDGRTDLSLIFMTDTGLIRRSELADFVKINRTGKMAIRLDDGARLISVFVASTDDDVVVATALGQSVRFPVDSVRVIASRDSAGVRAVTLRSGDVAVSSAPIPHSDPTPVEREVYLSGGRKTMSGADLRKGDETVLSLPEGLTSVPAPEADRPDLVEVSMSAQAFEAMRGREVMLLTVTQNGFGKRSSSHEFRCSNRGGSGITASAITTRTGPLVSVLPVDEEDDLVLMTDAGQTIRTRVREIGVLGRATQGVRVFRLDDGQKIVSVARIAAVGEDIEGDAPVVASSNEVDQ